MIGIFDSGSGGLTFLAAVRRRFPQYSYVYFGDYDNCPYGEKSPEEIQNLTTLGVQKLFDAGAKIVIIACNTASSWTLRKLQTETFPGRNILGVTIPGAEKVVELGLEKIVVFATEQTVKARAYKERVNILDTHIVVDEIALPGDLVRDIESLLPVHKCRSKEDYIVLEKLYGENGWETESDVWDQLASKYFQIPSGEYEGILLGCTHYPYVRKSLQKLYPTIPIIDPSEEAAEKLGDYISKYHLHPEIRADGEIIFL